MKIRRKHGHRTIQLTVVEKNIERDVKGILVESPPTENDTTRSGVKRPHNNKKRYEIVTKQYKIHLPIPNLWAHKCRRSKSYSTHNNQS